MILLFEIFVFRSPNAHTQPTNDNDKLKPNQTKMEMCVQNSFPFPKKISGHLFLAHSFYIYHSQTKCNYQQQQTKIYEMILSTLSPNIDIDGEKNKQKEFFRFSNKIGQFFSFCCFSVSFLLPLCVWWPKGFFISTKEEWPFKTIQQKSIDHSEIISWLKNVFSCCPAFCFRFFLLSFICLALCSQSVHRAIIIIKTSQHHISIEFGS